MPGESDATFDAWPDGFGTGRDDRRALLVLSALRGITPRSLIAVARERGSASATLGWIRDGRAGSENDQVFARSLDPDTIDAAARSCGARFVVWGSDEYPEQLRRIPDPPAALYVIGEPPPPERAAVAIVGARRSTASGKESAQELARGLALSGVTVVSGAARGIDASAHEGALGVGGPTLAVLGSGPDIVYPRGSRALLERIARHGTLVSEYAPGTPPTRYSFPARNRIVAGLCRATVVVEGASGSGSMITAEHAMEFGREVFALAGAVNNALAHVPLQLIRDGATMIRDADDLLGDLGLEPASDDVAERLELEPEERRVLGRIAEPTLPDRLASDLGKGIGEVMSILMQLELRGLVRSVGGRYETTQRQREASKRSARGTPPPTTSRTSTPAPSSRLAAIDER